VTSGESANDDSNSEAMKNKNMMDKDISDRGNPKLSGEGCHVGSIESENSKMYASQSQGSAISEHIAKHYIGLLNFSKDIGKPILILENENRNHKTWFKIFSEQSVSGLSWQQMIAQSAVTG